MLGIVFRWLRNSSASNAPVAVTKAFAACAMRRSWRWGSPRTRTCTRCARCSSSRVLCRRRRWTGHTARRSEPSSPPACRRAALSHRSIYVVAVPLRSLQCLLVATNLRPLDPHTIDFVVIVARYPLQRDPSARPSAAELLQHSFVAGATSEPASLRDRIIAYAASPRSVTLLQVGTCCSSM